VIKIGQVKAHFTPAGGGDFNQPTAKSQAVDGVAEHDAADQVKDDIGTLAAGRRTYFGRQILRAENQLLGNAMNRRPRMRGVSPTASRPHQAAM
jgi:hypothetical protein